MKIMNLIKCEFIKNYNLKKLIIIVLILLLSSIALVEINYLFEYSGHYTNEQIKSLYNHNKAEYERLSKIQNRTLEEEDNLMYYKDCMGAYQYLIDIDVQAFDWQESIVEFKILNPREQNRLIKLMKENKNDENIIKICNSTNTYFDSRFEGELHHLCSVYTEEELDTLYQDNLKEIEDYTYLLKENKYYLYQKKLLDNTKYPDDELEFINMIIDNKIENNSDFRVMNYKQYRTLDMFANYEFINENKFLNGDGYAIYQESMQFPNYKRYVKYYQNLKEEAIKNQAILKYSTKNNIPQDISYYDEINWQLQDSTYPTAKTGVNQIFHLGIVVMILVSITSSGIISKEHNKGTIKSMITTPVKRWKILFSKFIYLILHTYILWLIGLVLLSIYSGIRYGFSDLFNPKLIYYGNKVVEVNYYLYLLKDMIIASIPMISFLGILFFLSAITLNTAVTVGITTLLPIGSLFLWKLCSMLKLKLLLYMPFIYYDSGFIFFKSEHFCECIKYFDVSLKQGVVISLITIMILYFITTIVYKNNDIKN